MTDQDFRTIGWDFITTEYMRALPSGLDGLPLTSVPTVELPHYEYLPPDSMQYQADLARLHELHDELTEIADSDLFCGIFYGTPGGEVRKHLELDMNKFAKIAADIAKWVA